MGIHKQWIELLPTGMTWAQAQTMQEDHDKGGMSYRDLSATWDFPPEDIYHAVLVVRSWHHICFLIRDELNDLNPLLRDV